MGASFRSPFFFGLGASLTPATPPTTAWILGPLWELSTICAKQGTWGLQRTGDHVHGDSIASTTEITVTPGETLFASIFVKAGAGADGVIGFGLAFYDSSGGFLSSQFADTSSFPTDWTPLTANITVPLFAAIAIPIIHAVGHLNGLWCADSALLTRSGGRFVLSSLKHYYSDYVSYRN